MIQIDWNPAKKALRNFGLIGLVAFSAIALLIHYRVGILKKIPDSTTLRWRQAFR